MLLLLYMNMISPCKSAQHPSRQNVVTDYLKITQPVVRFTDYPQNEALKFSVGK